MGKDRSAVWHIVALKRHFVGYMMTGYGIANSQIDNRRPPKEMNTVRGRFLEISSGNIANFLGEDEVT